MGLQSLVPHKNRHATGGSDALSPSDIGAQPAGSYATLDTNSKLTASQLPDLAITEFLGACANQTEMLAKPGQKGDWVTRSDDGKVYVITGDSPAQASSWTALTYPVAAAQQSADWNATSGVTQILNKPTLGTAAATAASDYATSAQGAKADSALQPNPELRQAIVPAAALQTLWFTDAKTLLPDASATTYSASYGNLTTSAGWQSVITKNADGSWTWTHQEKSGPTASITTLTETSSIATFPYTATWPSAGITAGALISGPALSIANGGTGATTAEQARINLGITGGVTSYNDLTDLPTLGTAAATAASDYAPASHTHAIADTTGLQAALDGKASTSHKSTHAIGGSDALTPADIGAGPADIVSATAPASGVAGQRWVNTALGRSFDWINGAWVETGGGGGGATQGSGSPAIVQVFTATGSTTWTKPVGAKSVNIVLLGGGGGGGGGCKHTSANSRFGGGGGGGGGFLNLMVPASVIPDGSTTITIGAGGASGAGATINGPGDDGGQGGSTIFGSGVAGSVTYVVLGGTGGRGGSTTSGPAGGGSLNANNGGNGSSGVGGAGAPNSTVAAHATGGAGGGGGGGLASGASATTGIGAGNTGGRSNLLNLAGGAVGTAGTQNGNAVNGMIGVGSGGGGGNPALTTGQSGGNGGFPSSGGGGGGAAQDGNAGSGGLGGAGMAVITTYF